MLGIQSKTSAKIVLVPHTHCDDVFLIPCPQSVPSAKHRKQKVTFGHAGISLARIVLT